MKHTHIHIHRGGRTIDASWKTRDDEDFKESEHPRNKGGEFTSKGGEGAGGAAQKVITKAKGEATEKPKREPAKEMWTKAGGGSFTQPEIDRLRAMRVPPAWTEVKLNPDPSARLQVVGRDVKGRAQYLYSAEHSEAAAAEKFARLKAFNAQAPAIVEAARAQMDNPKLDQKTKDAAAVVKLISATGFRIGSETDTGADVQAHGATTLTGDHVQVKGDTIEFEFVGKKGVNIKKTLTDHHLAQYIAARQKANGKGQLFSCNDAQVRDWFHANGGDQFKVKDFRTWNGTCRALEVISTHEPPKTKAEFTKMRATVGKEVAAHLGNTPTVALASYIDPAVFGRWSHLQ